MAWKSLLMALAVVGAVTLTDSVSEAKQMIVSYNDGHESDVASAIENVGGTIVKNLPWLNAFAASFPDTKPVMLDAIPNVLQIEEDQKRYSFGFFFSSDSSSSESSSSSSDLKTPAPTRSTTTIRAPTSTKAPSTTQSTTTMITTTTTTSSSSVKPTDPIGSQQVPFGIPLVGADKVSDENAGNIMVCIIDSGYNLGHEDLPGNAEGTNDVGTGNWHEDENTHGTHVAGTIAALNNDRGVVGVLGSGKANIHIIKVFNAERWAYSSELIDAVHRCEEAAAAKGKKLVINMSLGGAFSSAVEKQAFEASYARGTFSIAAAGNSYYGHSYPASYPSVMSVAAVDKTKKIAPFSQRNNQVEISAPGVDVLSTLPGNKYGQYSGTSMACPHTVGVAALVWSHHANCPVTAIRNAMTSTAEDLGTRGRDNEYGYGLLNALRAKEYLDMNGC